MELNAARKSMTKDQFEDFINTYPEISDLPKLSGAFELKGNFIDKLEQNMIPDSYEIKTP